MIDFLNEAFECFWQDDIETYFENGERFFKIFILELKNCKHQNSILPLLNIIEMFYCSAYDHANKTGDNVVWRQIFVEQPELYAILDDLRVSNDSEIRLQAAKILNYFEVEWILEVSINGLYRLHFGFRISDCSGR